MKVKEFIERLKELDQEMDILAVDDEGEHYDADSLKIHEEELVKYTDYFNLVHYASEHYAGILKHNNPRLVFSEKRIYYVIR